MALRFALKVLITSLVVAGTSELARRSSLLAAALVSLPVTSVLAIGWLYLDTRDAAKVSELSTGIFWMVLPSLLFFLVLPLLLRGGVRFVFALPLACVLMMAGYAGYVFLLRQAGVKI